MLGKGGFAKCFLFDQEGSGKQYAGKVVAKVSLARARAKAKLQSEIRIHRALDHPAIVKFYTYFEDEANVYIMLEVCPNQTLMEMSKRRRVFTAEEAKWFGLQLLDGLRYLHGNNIVHRDLKLGNLFIADDMTVKIGDLGLATALDHPSERRKTVCGTPNYIAPEVLSNKSGHGMEVDTWAFGVIMFAMLYGKPPFETKDVKSTYKRIKNNHYTFPQSPRFPQAEDLIRQCLRPDPLTRPPVAQLMQHPFFAAGDSYIPRFLCRSALKEMPILDRSKDCIPGPTLIRSLLSRPIGGLKPQYAQRIKRRADGAQAPQPVAATGLPQKPHLPAASGAENMPPALAPAVPVHSSKAAAGAGGVAHRAALGQVPVNQGTGGAVTARTAEAPPPVKQQRSSHAHGGAGGGGLLRGLSAGRIHSSKPQASTSAAAFVRPDSPQTRQQPVPSTAAVVRAPAIPPRAVAATPTEGGSGRQQDADAGRASASAGRTEEEEDEGDFEMAEETKRVRGRPAGTPPGAAGAAAVRDGKRQRSTLDRLHSALERNLGPSSAPTGSPALAPARPGALRPRALAAPPAVAASEATSPSAGAAVPCPLLVSSWVDYTSKYGLGYLLSSGSVGVYFNDSTKMVLCPGPGGRVEYVERTAARTADGDVERRTMTIEDYPADCKKKITLLLHFRDYLRRQFEAKSVKVAGEAECMAQHHHASETRMPFVKKWVRTKHAVLFRMSNRTVHVKFFDNTALLLSSEQRRLEFVDELGRVESHDLARVADCGRDDITRRLTYTKDVLHQMVNGKLRHQPKPATAE